MNSRFISQTKTSWWSNDGSASAHRWLLLSHIVKYAPPTRTMFSILQQIIKVILRHFPNVNLPLNTKPLRISAFLQVKNSDQIMKSFDEVSDEIQMRVREMNAEGINFQVE